MVQSSKYPPMINALLVELEKNESQLLENTILKCCDNVKIDHKVSQIEGIRGFVKREKPKLIFFDINQPDISFFKLLYFLNSVEIDYIIVSKNKAFAYQAIRFSPTGFVLKPIEPFDLINAVNTALLNIKKREERERNKKLIENINLRLSDTDKIGIPTMEGFDFIQINEIVRCEGMQKCTLIVTKQEKSLISSYNLGEFKKLLEPFGFFSSHRSHLVNLKQIRKYKREGSIEMMDNTQVPVSRRRRNEFLAAINHV